MTPRERVISPFVTLLPAALLAMVLVSAPAHAAGGVGDLFVTSDASNVVRAYVGNTGALIGTHSTAVLGSGELGIHFGLLNGRYLVGSFGGGVDEYDATSGAYIKTYSTTGGWQWTGLYGPNGNVYIGSFTTGDVREYDATTGLLVSILYSVPDPADMAIGPNGNLYICQFNLGAVSEITFGGTLVNQWFLPAGSQANDIAFLPGGNIVVTAMRTNVMYRYSPALVLNGIYMGTGWDRPHGVDISPIDGNLYVADSVTTQVHVFDPVTMVELNAGFLLPNPGDKIVDLEFRRDNRIVNISPSTWSRIKNLVP